MSFLKFLLTQKNTTTHEKGVSSDQNETRWIGYMKKIEWLKHIEKKTIYFFLLLFLFISLIVTLSLLLHKNDQLIQRIVQSDSRRTLLMSQQMDEMHVELNQLSTSMQDSPQAQSMFIKLKDTFTEIEKNIAGVAKSEEVKKLTVDIDAHFNGLTKMLAESSHGKAYLDAQSLPFQVISVDVIAQQPFVSVADGHRILPLGIGDSLAGWKLVSADYDAVVVIFENDQGQYVKITALGEDKAAEHQ